MSECEYKAFTQRDANGQNAIWLDLSQFDECRNNAPNEVLADVPNGIYAKPFRFAYSKGFSADFDGAPYVFEDRGAVVFPDNCCVAVQDPDCESISGVNGYGFDLSAELNTLPIIIEGSLPVSLDVPTLMWSTDAESWSIGPVGEMWHTDFLAIKYLYFRSPVQKLSVSTDAYADDDDSDELHSVKAESINGLLRVDMSRFNSWITRDKPEYQIYLELGGKRYSFAKVFAASIVKGTPKLSPDYDNELLSFSAEIFGSSEYRIDIRHEQSGRLIADKAVLKKSYGSEYQYCISDRLASGDYSIEIFEADGNDDGFDDVGMYSIYQYRSSLLNADNLSGHYLNVRSFKRRGSQIHKYFSSDSQYWVADMNKLGRNTYEGVLVDKGEKTDIKVLIEFLENSDNRYFFFSFWDDYDECYNCFIYDSVHKELIKNKYKTENETSVQIYREYPMLFDPDYEYFGVLADKLPESFDGISATVGIFSDLWKEND